jgi:hypothetical protein
LVGSVEFQGAAPPGKPDEKPLLILEPSSQIERAFGTPTATGELDKQGAFRLKSVFAGKFRVKFDSLQENAYVKSVKLDGIETSDQILDLTRGVRNSTLKILVSHNGAEVSGTVVDENGAPSKAAFNAVMLAAKPEDISAETMKRAVDGAFSFKGVRPGKYRLFAADPYLVQDPSTAFRALFAKAPEIEVHEGDRLTKKVTMIGKEQMDAK